VSNLMEQRGVGDGEVGVSYEDWRVARMAQEGAIRLERRRRRRIRRDDGDMR
jgi:hypothetical protein